MDQADGQLDGLWRDNSIDQLLKGFDTPARTPYQERVVETVIEREGFGADEIPDLLYLNFKEIDYISHIWAVGSAEMNDAVIVQDQALRRFVAFLNRTIGTGNWVLALTADHGAMPRPEDSGGFPISTAPIEAGINERFDTDDDDVPVVDLVQPTQVFLNVDELQENGASVEDVAPVRDDVDPGADRGRWNDRRPGDREPAGVPGGVPLGPDDGAAMSARDPRVGFDPG